MISLNHFALLAEWVEFVSLFMATDPIILDRQILGLSKWALESHCKRHCKRQEDKSIIFRTYKAQSRCSNDEKGEKARRWQYDMQLKVAEQQVDIRPRAEIGVPSSQPLYTVGKESHG